MLTIEHVEHICKLGKGASMCRYLSLDTDESNGGFLCLQHRDEIRRRIDEEAVKAISSGNHKNQVPVGVNCGGYPVLRHIQQGYNIDNP